MTEGIVAGAVARTLVALAILIAVPLASLLGTRLAIPLLRRIGALDRPNERSSHDRPVPRGGGLVPVVLVGLLIAAYGAPGAFEPSGITAAAMAVVLAVLGLGDDVAGLAPWPRLGVQAGAIGLGLAALPADALVFQGLLDLPADRIAAGLLWLWFVNLYNFMDGAEGLAAGQTVLTGLGLGVALVGFGDHLLGEWAGFVALNLAGAALGFLWWNRPPARVFLGDAGSVPLGYLVGWLLLFAAIQGLWPLAVIVPLYFVADATTTLAWRLQRGRPPWRAHRDHAYQAAMRAGRSHGWVTSRVLALDALLVGLGLIAVADRDLAGAAGALAFVSVGGILWYFRRQRPS